MKKALFFGFVFVALVLTSCRKDYTCTYKNKSGKDDVQILNKKYNEEAKYMSDACEKAGGEWSRN